MTTLVTDSTGRPAPPGAAHGSVLVMRGITWRTYENLLADLGEQSGLRLTYDRGELEIMTLTPEHESLNRYLSSLIDLLVDESGLDVHPVGSSTFRREDLDRGFEPDSSFYFAEASLMRGKKRIDLSADPAPELVIEIDISHGSLDKLAIFARFGVSEVWRYDGAKMHLYRLVGTAFEERGESVIFPPLTGPMIEDFLRHSQTMTRRELKKWVSELVRL
jgi:Uma2 family endonuclease